MAGKTGKTAGTAKAASRAKNGTVVPPPSQAEIQGMDMDLTNGSGIGEFTASRDDILSAAVPESLLPDSEDSFYARDPFSADYADFLKGNAEAWRENAASVDNELRANLLAKPYMMTKPEESTLRGAAAVWRSLRDQLKNESLAILDRSDPAELLMLQRELRTRKMLLDSVSKGVTGLLSRVEQRLEAGSPTSAGADGTASDPDGASSTLPPAKD